jgi:hypothetical protein
MVIEIAQKGLVCYPDPAAFENYDRKPDNCNIYGLPDGDLYWFIYAPWNDSIKYGLLRSSQVVVVSRKTGEVIYKGSANDKGRSWFFSPANCRKNLLDLSATRSWLFNRYFSQSQGVL